MPVIEVRPFRRSDREQLTDLVNAHAGAVIPRMSVSVSTVLAQLEREPLAASVPAGRPHPQLIPRSAHAS